MHECGKRSGMLVRRSTAVSRTRREDDERTLTTDDMTHEKRSTPRKGGPRMGTSSHGGSREEGKKEMTRLAELQLEQSRIKMKGNALLNKEDRSESETTELREATVASEKIEIEIQAALVLADEADKNARQASPDPEALELRQLTDRSNLGSILSAVVEHRATSGPELELQQAHGLASNQIPLDLLRLKPEERAVSPAPTNTETMQDEIVQPVFADGAAEFLGVYQPTVDMGDAVYPVLSSRPSVSGPYTDSTDAPETTGAFDAELLAPESNSSVFFLEAHRLHTIPRYDTESPHGAERRALGKERRGNRQRFRRPSERIESGESQRERDYAFRELHQPILLRQSRWAIRDGSEHDSYLDGQLDLRARGHGLPLEQRRLQRLGFASGKNGRPSRERTRSGHRYDEAK